jgi:hypothetical protein
MKRQAVVSVETSNDADSLKPKNEKQQKQVQNEEEDENVTYSLKEILGLLNSEIEKDVAKGFTHPTLIK